MGSGERLIPITSAPSASADCTKLAPEKELLPMTTILSVMNHFR